MVEMPPSGELAVQSSGFAYFRDLSILSVRMNSHLFSLAPEIFIWEICDTWINCHIQFIKVVILLIITVRIFISYFLPRKFKQRREENGNVGDHNARGRGRRTRRNRDRRRYQEHPCSRPFKVDSESDSDSDSHIKLNKFPGLSSLAVSAGESCSESVGVKDVSIVNCAVSEKRPPTSISISNQNSPKPDFENNNNHLNVSNSENSSVNGNLEPSFHSNADKLNGKRFIACFMQFFLFSI